MASGSFGRLSALICGPALLAWLVCPGLAQPVQELYDMEENGAPLVVCTAVQTEEEGLDVVSSLTFTPDGRDLLLGCSFGALELRSSSGSLRFRRQIDRDLIAAVAVTPDGRQLLSASGSTLRRWSPEGELLGSFSCGPAPEDSINAIALSTDGTRVLTVHNDASARLWTLGGSLLRRFAAPGFVVSSGHRAVAITFLPGDSGIAVAHEDGIVRSWSLSGVPELEIDTDLSPLTSLALGAGGDLLAAGWFGAGRWDRRGQKRSTLREEGIVESLLPLPAAAAYLLAGRDQDAFMEIRDPAGRLWLQLDPGTSSPDGPLAISSDGRRIVLADANRLSSGELPGNLPVSP